MIPGTKEFFIAANDHDEWGSAHTVWGMVSVRGKCTDQWNAGYVFCPVLCSQNLMLYARFSAAHCINVFCCLPFFSCICRFCSLPAFIFYHGLMLRMWFCGAISKLRS